MNTDESKYGSDGLTLSEKFGLRFPEIKHIRYEEDAFWSSNRKASIKSEKGEVIYEKENIHAPVSWSDLAINVVASKYFYGHKNKLAKNGSNLVEEKSVHALVSRVVSFIYKAGDDGGYFNSKLHKDKQNFVTGLLDAIFLQKGSFNSPVWFNCGLHDSYGLSSSSENWRIEFNKGDYSVVPCPDGYKYPTTSACFILSVEDNMESILELAKTEGKIFKYGSGAGVDLSKIRSSKDVLSGGGKPSGPLSFMRIYDSVASVIKSGGRTRRSAKMQTLRYDHPDVMEFIEIKSKEEAKAFALVNAGYSKGLDGEAYSTVCFQNSNFTIRVSDYFMDDACFGTKYSAKFSEKCENILELDARSVLRSIAESTWKCGDPGLQYIDTIDSWHTCPNTSPITSSNPCSEFMFLDDTACNLASINLMKFWDSDNNVFNNFEFVDAVRLFISAQEMLVSSSSYPTEKIAKNSEDFRPLGLGYTNLGSLLMDACVPYDSDEGRFIAASITALMNSSAYLRSSMIAALKGPFNGFLKNRDPMLNVIRKHHSYCQKAINSINSVDIKNNDTRLLIKHFIAIMELARKTYEACIQCGLEHGFRNAQVTLLAPCGSIAFMMDSATTGIEPALSLTSYKTLSGGGFLKLVHPGVKQVLKKLRYTESDINDICKHIEEHGDVNGSCISDEHISIFDCALPPRDNGPSISWTGHVKMMAAVQPHLSGAISKTINMPEHSTVENIMDAYKLGHSLGLKSLAIYRDKSKESQPVNTKPTQPDSVKKEPNLKSNETPKTGKRDDSLFFIGDDLYVNSSSRKKLPDTRNSLTHKFCVGGSEGYITVGLYPDGKPGEVFITMAKEGSTVGGLMDTIGTAISIGLQYGVPLEVIINKFSHSRFEPSGFTGNKDIPMALSVTDYIARWLRIEFIDKKELTRDKIVKELEGIKIGKPVVMDSSLEIVSSENPLCPDCGSVTMRCGSCYRCGNCGSSLGCS